MLFLAPALLALLVFTVYPVARTLYNSFNIVLPEQTEFVGLANYIELFSNDPAFWNAAWTTLIWATVAPIIDVILGLLLALCLYVRVPAHRFLRAAWFTPVLVSYVVVGIIWMWIFNYDWGVINISLRAVGLDALAADWLGTPETALWALILVDTWKWTGFHMIVCLAAIFSLPKEVIEASELDNCGWFRKLIYIIVPMMWPVLLNLFILAHIGKMKIFDLVWITTRGGPLWSTETVSTYVYKRAFGWSTFDLGYPSAIASFWFFVVLFLVLILTWLFRQRHQLEY